MSFHATITQQAGVSGFRILPALIFFLLSGCTEKNVSPVLSGRRDTSAESASLRGFNDAVYLCRFDEALRCGEKFYEAASISNDSDAVFQSLAGMFRLYLRFGNFDRAFTYAKELYDIALNSDNREWLKLACLSLGSLNTSVERASEALSYYRRVSGGRQPGSWHGEDDGLNGFRFNLGIAEAFSQINESDSATRYFVLCQPAPDSSAASSFFACRGEFESRQGIFAVSLADFQQGLDIGRRIGDVYNIMRCLIGISNVYISMGNRNAALAPGWEAVDLAGKTGIICFTRDGYQCLYKAYDRLGSTDSANSSFRRYALAKDLVSSGQIKARLAMFAYEKQVEILHSESNLAEIKHSKIILSRNFLIAGVFILLLFIIVLYRNSLLKSKQAFQRRKLAETELVVGRLEAARITGELQRQKAVLEMQALQARMNPHFIFNCLNSINQFIVNNDSGRAADYLTKFARLMRGVLDKSGSEMIPLSEEVESIRLYLELESLRFEKPFAFYITVHKFDLDLVEVPSLFLQPFVENAIWHGLHPDQTKKGQISIDIWQQNDLLYCSVADNGIGINQSLMQKENQPFTRPSFGIELTRKRLQLRDPEGTAPDITLSETTDHTGQITGTTVRIAIPLQLT